MSRMINTAQIYEYVNGLTPRKTPHNLSYQTTTSGDMGYIYPLYWEVCVAGDKFELDAESVIRMQPQLAPLMHQIDAIIRWHFVPMRLIWRGEKWYNNWETFITGCVEGKEVSEWNKINPNDQVKMPDINELNWNPYELIDEKGVKKHNEGQGAFGAEIGTIWEAIGLPYKTQIKQEPTQENMPLSIIKRAYNKVWNDWWRDENLQKPVDLNNDTILKANWERDYFVSAGYEQQKGKAPQIGLGILKHELTNTYESYGGSLGVPTQYNDKNEISPYVTLEGYQDTITTGRNIWTKNDKGELIENGVTGAKPRGIKIEDHKPISLNVADLRALIAVQRALELDMRGGTRYIEFLQANFNVSPRDDRLQQAEFIGEKRTTISVSQVVSTASTGEGKAGELSGYSIGSMQQSKRKKYYAQEYGVIVGTILVAPKAQYQQGIDKQLWYKDKWDWYRPQLAYLSEQNIQNRELYYSGEDKDTETFAFQGNKDEMRIRSNKVMGLMRNNVNQNLAFWHLARNFGNRPKFNSDFIEMNVRKDIYQIPSQAGLIITVGWVALTERPIPATSDPGLLDHVYGEGSKSNPVARAGRRF